LVNYLGDLSQIAGIKLGEWADGVERGLRVLMSAPGRD